MDTDLEILGELIAEQAAHMDAATHRILSNIRDFDAKQGWVSASSCAHWLAWRVGWSLGTAREHVRVAKALGSLPAIDDALRLGQVSYCKVRAMTRVATPENERVLLLDAQLTTGSQLERICRKYKQLRRYADGASPQADAEARYVTRRDLDSGMVRIEAVLHPEEAALVWAAIDQATKDLMRGAGDESGREHVAAAASTGLAATSAIEPSFSESADRSAKTSSGDTFPTDESTDACACAGAPLVRGNSFNVERCVDDACDPAEALEPETHAALAHGPADARCPLERPGFTRVSAEPRPRQARPDDTCVSAEPRTRQALPDETRVPAETRPVSGRELAGPRFDRADGLVALARRFAVGESSRTPVEIVVTVSAEALRKTASAEDSVAVLDDGGCVIGETARRLACDAGIVAMVEDSNGQPLSVGRRTRSISAALWRALLKRDTCCRFPGCTNRVFLEGHHIEHWATGGETKLPNLTLLCGRHHRFVHEYGYRIELGEDGEPRFLDPRGRPAKDVPDRIIRDDLGWEHIVHANRDLDVEPYESGWSGETVQYADVCRALYLVDEHQISADDIC